MTKNILLTNLPLTFHLDTIIKLPVFYCIKRTIMKRIILITLFSAVFFTVDAQVNISADYQQYLQLNKKPTFYKKQNTAENKKINLQPGLPNQFERQAPPGNIDNMPVVGNVPILLNLIAHNSNGTDVYQSTIDNMFVLKPDSVFYSNMPVKIYKKEPQKNGVTP